MKVWIDIANAPHVRLFEPVYEALRTKGYEMVVTVRDHRETPMLARRVWPEAELDGGSSPRSRTGKAVAIALRAAHLARRARALGVDVALGHNSYAQIIAARLIGVPAVTAMDYEHQPANHLAFRLASRVVVPDAFPAADLDRLGARAARVVRYRGFKEELYLSSDTAGSRAEATRVGVPNGTPFVVVRLPPDGALYHREDNELVHEVVKLLQARGLTTVVIPRTSEQRERWLKLGDDRLILPVGPVDADALVAGAELFVGAGGTMTRESALLGVPTWSIFAGRSAAVDASLERQGRLIVVHSIEQARSLAEPSRLPPGELRRDILRALIEAVEGVGRRA